MFNKINNYKLPIRALLKICKLLDQYFRSNKIVKKMHSEKFYNLKLKH